MARYKKIHVAMYADAKFNSLSRPQPNGQSLWVYLLTGPHTTVIPGLSAAGEASLAEALEWPVEGFRKAFREVFSKGMAKADWKARVLWVQNGIKYNPPESPNVIRAWAKAWDEIPECALKVVAFTTLKAFVEGLGEGFQKAFVEAFPKGCPNQEQEQEQEEEKTFSADADSAKADRAEVDESKPDRRHDRPPADPDPTAAKAPPTPPRSRPKPKTPPRPEHGEFIAYFHRKWREVYGADYTWKDGQDGKNAKWILDRCDRDLGEAKALADAFLADRDNFLVKERHRLGLLVSRFDTYRVAAPDDGGDNGESWSPPFNTQPLPPEILALESVGGKPAAAQRPNGETTP